MGHRKQGDRLLSRPTERRGWASCRAWQAVTCINIRTPVDAGIM